MQNDKFQEVLNVRLCLAGLVWEWLIERSAFVSVQLDGERLVTWANAF